MAAAPVPRVVRWTLAVMCLWTVAYAVHDWLPSHPLDGSLLGDYPDEAMEILAAVLCGAAGLRRGGRERLAWLLIAVGIGAWSFGDIYWTFALASADSPPIPSLSDVGYLLFGPLTFAGIVVLARTRLARVPRTLAVDGISAALAIGAVCTAVVVEPVLAMGGTKAAVVTNVSYPVVDMVLMGLIVCAIALRGWRIDRTWALLATATLVYGIADSLYLVQSANGTYASPGPLDFGWIGALVLYAIAAWSPPAPQILVERRGGMAEIMLPICFGLVGLGVLVGAAFTHLSPLAVGLAAASLVAVLVRLIITFAENSAMLRTSRHEALTDALTELGNRRALTLALERALPTAHDGDPLVLVLFDLDGFKHYNDSFGHPAGDDLLARLGRHLGRAVEGRGRAYRMGGDEFCALIRPGHEVAMPIVEAAAAALFERGDGFEIGCSYGSISLPREAADSADALRIADHRMYAAKGGSRVSAGRQSKDVLLRALAERDPDLGEHLNDVAHLAADVATRIGLQHEEVEHIRHAAELHDIGKVAIPDAILHKPGPLDEHEWAFIRRHTLIGARIIDAAPALGPVATLVRSSHERYDGGGYPDGLVGTEIPLGSRIVAICDAFDAMTTDRAYRQAMPPQAALAELRGCAGAQFDPVVVEAFCAAWAARTVTALIT